jgi:hypothetical protein
MVKNYTGQRKRKSNLGKIEAKSMDYLNKTYYSFKYVHRLAVITY